MPITRSCARHSGSRQDAQCHPDDGDAQADEPKDRGPAGELVPLFVIGKKVVNEVVRRDSRSGERTHENDRSGLTRVRCQIGRP
jgi:hypothetical protein